MHQNALTEAASGCPVCGSQFNPARPWQRFCSPKCRAGFHATKTGGKKYADLVRRVEALERHVATLRLNLDE